MQQADVCSTASVCRYVHVNATCLEQSPTAVWHRSYTAAGGTADDLIAHIEERSDYDGLAVAWGIGHKQGVRIHALVAHNLTSLRLVVTAQTLTCTLR